MILHNYKTIKRNPTGKTKSIGKLLIFCLAALLLTIPLKTPNSSAQEQKEPFKNTVLIVENSPLSLEKFISLAKLAIPEKITLEQTTPFNAFFIQWCGNGHGDERLKAYAKIFFEKNKKLRLEGTSNSLSTTLNKGTDVKVPFCTYVKQSYDNLILVSPGITLNPYLQGNTIKNTSYIDPAKQKSYYERLSELSQQRTGIVASTRDDEILEPPLINLADKKKWLQNNQPKESIARIATFDNAQDQKAAENEVGRQNTETDPQGDFVTWRTVSKELKAKSCRNKADEKKFGKWPADLAYISQRLKKAAKENPVPANIIIADTGISALFTTKYSDYFIDKDNYGENFPYGKNVINNTYLHGSKVSAISAGLLSAQSQTLSPISFNGFIQLYIYRLLQFNTQTKFPPPAVPTSISFAQTGIKPSKFAPIDEKEREFNIINLSVAYNKYEQLIVQLTNRKGVDSLLVVTAAGNDNKDVDLGGVYPATLGGQQDNYSLITVGAHNRKYQKTHFSNYGALSVDIFAPGCEIKIHESLKLDEKHESQTYDGDENSIISSGTSMAAPFVSFTAGLLHSLGIETAAEKKQRIILASDIYADLKPWSWSGAALNIPKAISINVDVIDYTPTDKSYKETIYGYIETSTMDEILTACSISGYSRYFKKISFLQRDPHNKASAIYELFFTREHDKKIVIKKCSLSDDFLAKHKLQYNDENNNCQKPKDEKHCSLPFKGVKDITLKHKPEKK